MAIVCLLTSAGVERKGLIGPRDQPSAPRAAAWDCRADALTEKHRHITEGSNHDKDARLPG